MKRVPLHEYKYKKLIADKLEKMVNQRYVEISDEEFARINNAVESYSEAIQQVHSNLETVTFTEQQKSKLLQDIEQLEADIQALKQDTFYTDEEGLFFTDENGNIGAKLNQYGLETIGEARDLSIVDY